MTLVEVREIVTIIGVLVSAASLAVAAYNIILTMRTNRAKFWLDLRTAFSKHDEVHFKLRSGEWSDNAGPRDVIDKAKTEAYMGLFEHCEIMLEQKLIDDRTFKKIYGYRLDNLVANHWVVQEKLRKRGDKWRDFIDLLKRMSIKY